MRLKKHLRISTTHVCCESAALSMPANLEKSAADTGLEKVSFHSDSKEGRCQRMFKLPHNCTHFTSSKVMLKILPARLQQYVNQELPDVQAELGKGTRTRDQIANIHWIVGKAREFQKNIYFYFIDYTKAFDCVQFSSATQSCPTLCEPMNRSTPGLPVHHQLPEFTQTHVRRVSDAIQPSHPQSSPSPAAPNPSQHQSLFQ